MTIQIVAPHNAPAGSTSSATGNTSVLAAYGMPVVFGASVTNGGQPVAATVTGSAQNAVGTNGGELIGTTARAIGNDGAGLIGNDGAGLIGNDGAGLIGNAGGTIVASGAGNIARRATTEHPLPPPQRLRPRRNQARDPLPSAQRPTPPPATTPPPPMQMARSSSRPSSPMASPVPTPTPSPWTESRSPSPTQSPTSIRMTATRQRSPRSRGAAHRRATQPSRSTITGTGFVNGSVISYGGVQLPTTFISATQVRATIPGNAAEVFRRARPLRRQPGPERGASLPTTFTVAPAMTVTSLSPAVVPPGNAQFTLTVTGTNFTDGATVVFGGTNLTTTFVTATQLTAVVPANLVTQAGTAAVTVIDPLGGATSAVTFSIAVVAPLPPSQPPGPSVPGTNPLPASRPSGSPTGGSPPAPVPPPRP